MTGPEADRGLLSRRAILRAAALAAGVIALGPACSSSDRPVGAAGDPDPLRTLGRELAAGPDGPDLRVRAAEVGAAAGAVGDQSTARGLLDRLDAERRADFAARRTVIGRGWILSRTEAAVLVAYAGSAR